MASACVNTVIEPYTWHSPEPDLSPDFEFFRIDDPTVTMLPADELFSDGKLKPISTARSATSSSHHKNPNNKTPRTNRVSTLSEQQHDPVMFSPRAPTCSIKWKNILKLKKLNKTAVNNRMSPNSVNNHPSRSLIGILNRAGSSNTGSTGSNPRGTVIQQQQQQQQNVLKESDTDSVSTSSRLSLSSSSSGHDHDEVVLKPGTKTRVATSAALAESPRMNSYGKVVFERSSSSPGSFNGGGPRCKHSIERSYSAHVRVAPVLNVVPVKFGVSMFGSSGKRDSGSVRVPRRNSRNGNRTEQA